MRRVSEQGNSEKKFSSPRPRGVLYPVLDVENQKISLRDGEGDDFPLTALTPDFSEATFDLKDGRKLRLFSGAGRYWFDTPVEIAIDGQLIDGNYGRDRFWARAWCYFLGLRAFVTLLTTYMGFSSLIFDPINGFFRLSAAEKNDLVGSLIFLVALGFTRHLYLTSKPRFSFYCSSLVVIAQVFWDSRHQFDEGFFRWWISNGGLFILILWICIRSGIAVNQLAKNGHPEAPARGPWISWDEWPYPKPPGSFWRRWTLQ